MPAPPPPPPRGSFGQFRPPPPVQTGPANTNRNRQTPSSSNQVLSQQGRLQSSISTPPPPPPPSSAPARFHHSPMGQPRFAPPPPASRINHAQSQMKLNPPTAPQPQRTGMYPGNAGNINSAGFQSGYSVPPRGIAPPMPPAAPANYGGGGIGMMQMNNNNRQPLPPPTMANAPYAAAPPGPPEPPAYNNTIGYGLLPPPLPNGYGHAAVAPMPPPMMNQQQQPGMPPPMMNQMGMPPLGYPSAGAIAATGAAPQYEYGNEAAPVDLPEIPIPTMPHGIIPEAYYPKSALLAETTGGPMTIQTPPPANSRFIVLDDGNASPHLLRSTLYAIPHERSVLQSVLGSQAGNNTLYHNDKVELLSTPLAVPSAKIPSFQHHQLPDELRLTHIAVDGTTDKIKPPRCQYCNAYVNPFWSSSKCNFCNRTTSHHATASLANLLGTVEYPVAGPYITRGAAPVQPICLYAIDATAPSCQKYVELLMRDIFPKILECAIKEQENIFVKPKVRVGIVFCLASGVYIPTGFLPHKNSNNPEFAGFTVMPDIQEDPYNPLPLEEWTFDILHEFEALENMCTSLLETLLPQLIQERVRVHNTIGNSKDQPIYQLSCGGAAMGFLVDALRETGGRATWISWRRPNCGVGKLMDRERAKLVQPAYKPVADEPFYKALTAKCQEYKVAMDIVLHTNPAVPKAFLDVSTMGQVCAGSNGKLIRISAPNWHETFVKEVFQRASGKSGWDCVFKVRCSTGLRVHSLVTNDVGKFSAASGITDDSPDLELPVVQADTCIGFKLEHRVGGIPKNRSFVYIQTALLYTNAWTGERKVRVSTLGLKTCQTADEAFASFDFGTLAACEIRRAAQNSLQHDQDLQSTRGLVYDRMVAILSDYRKTASKQQPHLLHNSHQLVLPEKLKLYPTLVMAMLKSPLLREGVVRQSQLPNPTADERAHFVQEARRVTPTMAFHLVHPLLFQVPADGGDDDEDTLPRSSHSSSDGTLLSELRHAPFVALPAPLRPTISCLEHDQVYLMDTGLILYVVIERSVSIERLNELKRADEGPLGRLMEQLRNYAQVGSSSGFSGRSSWPPVIFINAEKDKPLYHDMLKWMVEDASASEPDAKGFYRRLHSQIQEKL